MNQVKQKSEIFYFRIKTPRQSIVFSSKCLPVNAQFVVFGHISFFMAKFTIHVPLNRCCTLLNILSEVCFQHFNDFSLFPEFIDKRAIKPSYSDIIRVVWTRQEKVMLFMIHLMVGIRIIQRIIRK